MFRNITFAYPYLLYLLLLIPIFVYFYIRKFKTNVAEINFPSLKILEGAKKTLRERLVHLPFTLKMLSLAFLIVAAARPQTFSTGENVYTEGIDIVMLLDISGSMLAEDFKPNRLEAAKKVIDKFIQGRKNDRIGLVIFARESFTQCPLTIDYSVLRELLKQIKSGMLEDGTAIGIAIANGVNRLKDSKSKSKIMILLTDGVNNAGEIDPITAAQIAKDYGIRIYTVGVGTRGKAPYPFMTPFGKQYQMVPVEIDENTLRQIAQITGGKYFRATDNRKLAEIYRAIDKMEKTRIRVTSYRHASEKFYSYAGIGLLFLLIEILLSNTYLKNLP